MAALGAVVLVGSMLSIPSASMSVLTLQETGWVIGMGIAATLGHAFIVLAAGKAPTNLLAPFQYVEIIGATILGYLVFGDIPANSTILGVSIIIASGLYLFHRERVAARKQAVGG
jgi:drug/metabolite transporter (DMT)-like permease